MASLHFFRKPERSGDLALLCILALLTLSCARPRPPQEPVARAAWEYERAPANGKVLAATKVAKDLLKAGKIQEAQRYYQRAAAIVEAVFSEDAHGKKAESLFHGEDKKIFRGEPYERAMLYHFYGLTYLLMRDWENARNCYRSLLVQDSFAAEQQHQSDFFLADYMEAYCNARLDEGDMEDTMRRIAMHFEALMNPPTTEKNLLIFYETGRAPDKIQEGQYSHLLAFNVEDDPIWAVEAKMADKRYRIYDAANVSYQAVTRGGRFVDHILRRKAVYKKTANVSANILFVAGLALLVMATQSDGDAQKAFLIAAGVCLALGVTIWLIGKSMNPSADTRMMKGLPNALFMRPCAIPEGAKEIEITTYDRFATPKLIKKKSVALPEDRNQHYVLYVTRDGSLVKNW